MPQAREIVVALLAIVLVGATSASLCAQSSRSATAPAPSGSRVLALGGSYPGAGQILGSSQTPPVREVFALQYDGIRRWVWAGAEASRMQTGAADIYMLDHEDNLAVLSSLVTDELGTGASTGALIDGPVDELALLANGDLLCADYNGDQQRFDDTLFLLATTGHVKLAGVWYLDDMGGAAQVARNTNTNVPRDRIDGVAGLAVRRTVKIAAGNQAQQEIFVGQYASGAVIRRIELTPGTPGTWATRQVYASPTGDSVDGMDWDPDLQCFWMTCANTGLVYEVALDAIAASFRVLQVFPSQGVGGAMAITAIRGSAAPHRLVEAEGFSVNGSMQMLDSGHPEGRGRVGVTDEPGAGPVALAALFDPDCVGLQFRVLASFGRAAIPFGDRYLELAPDLLLDWSLKDPRFLGRVDASGAARLNLPVALPPNVGPLYFQVAVLGDARTDHLGIKRLTPVVSHLTR